MSDRDNRKEAAKKAFQNVGALWRVSQLNYGRAERVHFFKGYVEIDGRRINIIIHAAKGDNNLTGDTTRGMDTKRPPDLVIYVNEPLSQAAIEDQKDQEHPF